MGGFFGKVLAFMYDLQLFILVLTLRGFVRGLGLVVYSISDCKQTLDFPHKS